MLGPTRITCGSCGREQADDRRLCELCSVPLPRSDRGRPEAATGGPADLLRGTEPQAAPSGTPEQGAAAAGLPREFRALRPPPRPRPTLAEPALYIAIGIPLAFVFSLTPILGFMGWFLASLFHEVGHAALAWFSGHPSVPAISLTGHAAAVHGEPLWFLRLVIVASVVTLGVQFLDGRRRVALFAAFAIVYPLLIWTRFGGFMFLVSGHLGELAAASLCLWRATDGEACHHRLERAAYAMLGWFLCGDNILLSFGLAFSASSRAEYATNGSFGLQNDYIRIANEYLPLSLEQVGFAMGMIALAVPAATLAAFALTHRRTH